MGSSREASVPDLRFLRSEKIPSSNFLEFLTGRPKAWNRNDRHRTMSVPEMWKRLFLCRVSPLFPLLMTCLAVATYHRMQETYSPVGRRNRRMYWSGCQSTGAEMRKYFTKDCQLDSRLAAARHTVVNLLERDLSIVGQRLLSLGAEHESLRLLRCHCGVLRVHDALFPPR